MSAMLVISVLLYSALIIALYVYWRQIPHFGKNSSILPSTRLTVIIPVRNEAENIFYLLKDLEKQTYPGHLLEVIVVDDYSSDRTIEMVEKAEVTYTLTVVSLQLLGMPGGKKSAVQTGIGKASGTIIVTTDGDCRVQPGWLALMENYFVTSGCKLVFGGVTFHDTDSIFEQLQIVEFASLTGSGAASLAAGFPNMCNAANLAYTREVFLEVEGYQGFDLIASGDDEFLMHKVARRYPHGVKFLKNPLGVVTTSAKPTIATFLQQRQRWAGKWKYYIFNSIKVLAGFIFIVNCLLLVSILLCLIGNFSFQTVVLCWLLKSIVDAIFIRDVMLFYAKKFKPGVFLLTALIYPVYVCLIGITSTSAHYSWKGRNL